LLFDFTLSPERIHVYKGRSPTYPKIAGREKQKVQCGRLAGRLDGCREDHGPTGSERDAAPLAVVHVVESTRIQWTLALDPSHESPMRNLVFSRKNMDENHPAAGACETSPSRHGVELRQWDHRPAMKDNPTEHSLEILVESLKTQVIQKRWVSCHGLLQRMCSLFTTASFTQLIDNILMFF